MVRGWVVYWGCTPGIQCGRLLGVGERYNSGVDDDDGLSVPRAFFVVANSVVSMVAIRLAGMVWVSVARRRNLIMRDSLSN